MTTPTNPNADHENARLARAHCARCYKTLASLTDAAGYFTAANARYAASSLGLTPTTLVDSTGRPLPE